MTVLVHWEIALLNQKLRELWMFVPPIQEKRLDAARCSGNFLNNFMRNISGQFSPFLLKRRQATWLKSQDTDRIMLLHTRMQ